MNILKIYQVVRKEDFQLLWHLQEDRKLLFLINLLQEWILQQEDTFGNY
jgi:hypothetical protein